jgi:hypothetical protein
MWESTQDAFRLADPNLIKQMKRSPPCLAPRQSPPQSQTIGELALDPTPGIEGGKRILRYQCNLVSEDSLQISVG